MTPAGMPRPVFRRPRYHPEPPSTATATKGRADREARAVGIPAARAWPSPCRDGGRSGCESAFGAVGRVVWELVGASLRGVIARVVGIEIGTQIGQGGDPG